MTMQTSQLTQREQEIVDFWRHDSKQFVIPGGVLFLIAGIIIGAFIFGAEVPFISNNNMLGYSTNIFTELLSVGVTILVLNRLSEQRENTRLKSLLLARVKNPSRDIAVDAIEEIRVYGWLHGRTGLLQAENLFQANLQNANLWGANLNLSKLTQANLSNARLQHANLLQANLVSADLSHAILRQANLQSAYIRQANLQEADLLAANLERANLLATNLSGANLREANLKSAHLVSVDLSQANLWQADLAGADLWGANFSQANLWEANLKDAILAIKSSDGTIRQAQFDEHTTLPDGLFYQPERGIEQLARFGAVVEALSREEIEGRRNQRD